MNAHVKPLAAWTDFTPTGPWSDGTTVVRNLDGVGFQYSASLNALIVIPNESFIAKNANNFIIQNLPAPSNGGDAANKTYVDSHAGGGGGIPEAPTDGQQYGRQSSAWSVVVPNPAASSTTPIMDGTAAVGTGTTWARADHVHPSDTTKAPLVSPNFTGTPLAPTPTAGTNTTQLATTAFVVSAVGGVPTPPVPSSATPVMDGIGAAGIAVTYSRGDHVHPSDTSRAPLASPALTGTPTSTTPATADNSTNIATTAYVKAQGYLIGNQTVTLTGDITGNGTTSIPTVLATVNSNIGTFQGITVNGKGLVTGAVNMSYAPLASPSFTGVPLSTTPTVGDNSTKIATTAFVTTAVGSGGGGGLKTVTKQKFTSSGTYTPTAGMVFCTVEAVGGGGGGGSATCASTTQSFGAGGGGSGGYSRSVLTATAVGASQTVTIGAGGSGGAAGSNNGGAGGNTSLGVLIVANGGSGGYYGSSAQNGLGGLGGVVGTGDLNAAGAPGGASMYNNATLIPILASGFGGSSFFGGGANSVQSAAGNNASSYGSGGSGAHVQSVTSLAGGAGSSGIVFITEFLNV